MADRKRPNTAGSSTVNRLSELGRRFKQRTDLPSSPETDILTRIGEMNQIMEAQGAHPQDIAEAQMNIEKLYAQLEPLETRRMNTASKAYVSGATTATRAANLFRDVNSLAGSAGMMGTAATMTGMSTYQLEQMKAQSSSAMISTGNKIVDIIGDDPESRSLGGLTNQLGSQINQSAQYQAALDLQRKMGMDVRSRYMASRESVSRMQGMLGGIDLQQAVRTGQVGNREDIERTMRSDLSTAERFQRAQERYANDPEKFERFQKAIDKLTQSAEKAAGTLKEMDRQGVTGGGGIGGFLTNPKVQAGMQLIQAGSRLGSEVFDMWTFQNPLRERQNQTGYANIMNRQFDDTLGALGGDMSALRRLGVSYGAAADANNMAKTGSKASTAFSTLGSIAGVGLAAAGGIATATGVGAGIGIPLALAGIGLASAANTTVGNWNQQAGERGVALAEAEIRRRDALSRINDASTQSYMDYSRNIGSATVGMGGLRFAGFEQMTSQNMLSRMSGVGINPQMAAQMAAMGVQNLGRDFNPNQIVRAGELRQGGYMNEQQYMQSLTQLSNVGGNAAQNMEEILKNAVANGMDNAKSIAQMVQATSTLASKSAAAGIDTLAGSTQVIGKIMDRLEDAGVPINMRGAAAQQSAAFVDQTLSDKGLNLNTITRWQQTGAAFRGASMAQIRKLTSMNAEEMEQLRGPNGAAFAKRVGLDNLLVDPDGKVNPDRLSEIQREQFTQVVNTVMPRGMSESARRKFIGAGSMSEVDRLNKEGGISDAEMRDFRAAAAERGISLEGTLGAVGAERARAGTVRTATEGGAGEIDKQRQAEAEGQRRVLEQGREVIDALGGLKGLTTALQDIAKNFNPKEMSEGVQKAAGKFDVPVQKFSEAVDKFASALDNTSKK